MQQSYGRAMTSVLDALTPASVKEKRRFNSFAVLDLETANLPEYNYNKVGITELSVYGFAVEELELELELDEIRHEENKISHLPRVLHKLSLMFNPRMAIMPEAEKVTGLNNFMLEAESPFNENAAKILLGFLTHLRQPVCLVAHNGFRFDFPIIKHILEKFESEIPTTVLCLDSLRAFHDIDQMRKNIVSTANCKKDEYSDFDSKLDEQSPQKFSVQAKNETTPNRPTISSAAAAIKRKYNNADDEIEFQDLERQEPKSKRVLFFEESSVSTSKSYNSELQLSYQIPSGKRWFPPKEIYKLGNIYKRIFSQKPIQSHYAEADVLSLTHLMLHYGKGFIEYAENHAIEFDEIPRLGKNTL